jgi:hypothetical protein
VGGGEVSVSGGLHVATFQKTNVRGPPPSGTSSRKSFLKLSLLPVALCRVVVQSEQHRISLPDVILRTYEAGDSTDMTSKRTRSGKDIKSKVKVSRERPRWP